MNVTTDAAGVAYLLLTTKETADMIGMSVPWLERDRWSGEGKAPPYVKLGRKVRYKRSDVMKWLEQLTSDNSAQTPNLR